MIVQFSSSSRESRVWPPYSILGKYEQSLSSSSYYTVLTVIIVFAAVVSFMLVAFCMWRYMKIHRLSCFGRRRGADPQRREVRSSAVASRVVGKRNPCGPGGGASPRLTRGGRVSHMQTTWLEDMQRQNQNRGLSFTRRRHLPDAYVKKLPVYEWTPHAPTPSGKSKKKEVDESCWCVPVSLSLVIYTSQ